MSKASKTAILAGLVLLAFSVYCLMNTKELSLRCKPVSEGGAESSELVLTAKVTELPFGLIYINGYMHYQNLVYRTSHQILPETLDALKSEVYELSFKDLETDKFTDYTQIVIPSKVLRGEGGTAVLHVARMAVPSGKLTSVSLVCEIEGVKER